MEKSMKCETSMTNIITNVVIAGNFLAIGVVISMCVSLFANMPTWS